MLIVYEGYEEATIDAPLSDDRTLVKSHSDDVTIKAMEDDSHSGGNCSYDADASDDSIELNLSLHEETDYRKEHSRRQTQNQRAHSHHHHNNHHHQQQQQHQYTTNHLISTVTTSTTIDVTTTDSHSETINATSNSCSNGIGGNSSHSSSSSSSSSISHTTAVTTVTRGPTPFVPISEETVFLDADHIDPVTSSGISTMSSPMSCDSWMNYSSNSSDDLSCISERIHVQQQQDSSEESSIEFDSPLTTAQSTPKSKRNFNKASLLPVPSSGDGGNLMSAAAQTVTTVIATQMKQQLSKMSSSVSDKCASDNITSPVNAATTVETTNTENEDDLEAIGHTKRLRGGKSGKNNGNNNGTAATTTSMVPSASSGSIKRKAVNRTNSISNAICDIRMIDFAHTTFVRKNGDIQWPTPMTTVQHEGPDNGFLRGIESLKRLLTEIIDDHESNK